MFSSCLTRSTRRLLLCLILLCLVAYAVTPPAYAATGTDQQAKPPAEALAALKTPDDLVVEQVLCEPDVRQPLFIDFDERGRMWVVEYIQYPYPAGLKILSEDKFLRATYDKVPPPPPNHFRGLDKITIHEDTDGDGKFDKQKTFIDGLNIVTSFARGRGGVWVLNPPYLLFYADRDGDDVPDGDPEVHLQGFGLEDTHSCANNLRWGPDGWLYACQGSTVSGDIVRPGLDKKPVHSMGQLIWRYHPEQRRYEIFAEGGGNAFGLEIDSAGRIYSGHNGGDTRGFHYVQGGYFQKGFSKHGPLSNPYTFGYFPAMKHAAVPRFTHAFVIYEGGALPPAYQGRLFGVAPLQSHVVMSQLSPDGSTFKTEDVGYAITSTDDWFRPVAITVGPDGAMYVCDMYEGQIAHLRHHEGKVDTSTGRVYRLRSKSAAPLKPFDLSKLSSSELVGQLSHSNKWFRHTALRLLGDRKDASVVAELRQHLEETSDRKTPSREQFPLEALWALNLCGGFDGPAAMMGLNHADPYVRLWSVRLLGDRGAMAPELASRLSQIAQSESNIEVRSQLACTARRLSADEALPIVRGLLAHDEDLDDVHLPLLLWWAIEAKAESDRDAVVGLFNDPAVWQRPLVTRHLLHRLMRRYAATGSRKDLVTCAKLLNLAPSDEERKTLMRGFEEAFQGRSLTGLPDELVDAMTRFGGQSLTLALRQGKAEAVSQALALIADDKTDASQRLQYVQIFGEVRQPQAVPVLLKLLQSTSDDGLRVAALAALARYDAPEIAPAVLAGYSQWTDDVRSVAQSLLAGRKSSSLTLLEAIDAGNFDASTIPPDVARSLTVHRDPHIAELVTKHFGNVEGATTAQMQEQIARLTETIRGGSGSPYGGKKLFTASCAKCHTLFGQGGKIGPDLTSYKRDDVANMLINVVNPSAEVREGFETYQALTADGRVVSGFLVERDNVVLVLRTADGQTVSLEQSEIEELAPQRKSLMPEGLIASLSDQDVRDLFAYLRSTQPLND
ncbi:MAG TPA: PVC-type heme-binding CxxCH protein [Pirellulales bacterium]|nr:PVC-type heme-binding CxxCH protein [Pirellulales bacterium]